MARIVHTQVCVFHPVSLWVCTYLSEMGAELLTTTFRRSLNDP